MKLNLPEYIFKFQKKDEKTYIFDSFRKKYVVLTPEEWVRQNFLTYLVEEKGYRRSLIVVEASIRYDRMYKRCDALIYNSKGEITMIIECKSVEISLSQKVFDQAVRYNYPLGVKYITVTNGLSHYCCEIDYISGNYSFLDEIPLFFE